MKFIKQRVKYLKTTKLYLDVFIFDLQHSFFRDWKYPHMISDKLQVKIKPIALCR